MKKAILRMILIFFILSIGLVSPPVSWAGIAKTVHNLSASWPSGAGADPRTIRADTEDRICVFCHTPHNASPAIPLWNHEMTGANYTMYDSAYLQRVDGGYDVPADLGFFPDIGYRSRMCLSCHDGTVALGSVYNIGGSSATISMTIPGGGDKMPATSAGFIDTYLKDDHPVAIKYDDSAFIQFTYGPEQRPIELDTGSDVPPIVGITPGSHYKVRLYSYPPETKGYVECTSCHDPHTETEQFLVKCGGGDDCSTFAKRINVMCDKCHEKINWTGSVHQTSGVAVDNPVGETLPIPGLTVAEAGCAACHKTHGGGGEPYLLRKFEEETCFNRVGAVASTSCHGQTLSVTKSLNIYGVFLKLRGHPVISTSNKHTNLDVLDDGNDLRWDIGSGNQHAECVDCHNPHQAKPGTHNDSPDASGWYPLSVTANTNDVSDSILGVTGIDHPNDDPLWDDIDLLSYRTMNSADKEYQICFKCHSSYALRNFSTPVTVYTLTVSGATITDQAWEFSRGNKSAHPVRVTLNNMLTGSSGTSTPGSYSPKALEPAQMGAPWNQNCGSKCGNNTMYCSDCHGADNEDGTDPKGPHGSNENYMLKGPGQYWPTKSDGTTLWDLDDRSTYSSGGLFCNNCHVLYDTSWKNNVHAQWSGKGNGHRYIACVGCHVAVPHGSKRSRLIGYRSDPSPYDYNNNSLKVTGFKKAAGPNNYSKGNCSALSGFGCTGGMRHSTSISGDDP
ncbi:MAG TPA: cytochrome C [Nitrospirae bacterium]|nr:doubled CXXCH motif [bacterium BMS3Abin10]GBE39162.1 doubled CXXCH motif [bacterium BMS3Bbin08]HDK17022.1 cytochrome C [Nitrospirota bacterium]HDZ84775.1 cytochrome C [Nitrospirota bacterium]